jgi:hypothetical protein
MLELNCRPDAQSAHRVSRRHPYRGCGEESDGDLMGDGVNIAADWKAFGRRTVFVFQKMPIGRSRRASILP